MILKTYARLWSASVDEALRVLEPQIGAPAHLRFAFADVELAAIGDFLVIAGTPEAWAKLPAASATVVVDQLDATRSLIEATGGQITFGPATSETGSYLYARHGDGAEVEYVEWNEALRSRILGR